MSEPSPRQRLGPARALIRENPVLLAIAGIGFAVSFQTIAAEARAQHMPGWPVLYPLLIDAGILGFTIEARKAIDDGRSDLVPRALAWLLSVFTLYVNAHGSPSRDWLGVALHTAAPVMWIAFLELTRWRKLRKARAQHDRIPRARWLISPRRTAGMRKRMVLHNVTSYAVAVRREEARLLGMDLAASAYGRRWRKDAPVSLRHHLREGTLPPEVEQACEYGSPELPAKVEAWVTGADAARVRAAHRVRQQKQELTQPADAPPAPRPRPKVKHPAPGGDKRADAERLKRENPDLQTADLVRLTGVSRSTAQRINREARQGTPSLSLIREG